MYFMKINQVRKILELSGWKVGVLQHILRCYV